MSLVYSNVLAVVAVVCLPIVGGKWIAPKLSVAASRCFFTLSLWGIPYAIGQCAQEDRWGPIWVQYHLLDLSYAPWGTALVMGVFPLSASLLGRTVSGELAFMASICAILTFGYLSELWDTMVSRSKGYSLGSAIDVGDYATITVGGAITIVVYTVFQKTSAKLTMG